MRTRPPFQVLELTGPAPAASGPGWLLQVEPWPLEATALEPLRRFQPLLWAQLEQLDDPIADTAGGLLLQIAGVLLRPVPLKQRHANATADADTTANATATADTTPTTWLVSCLQHRLAGHALGLARDLVLLLPVLQDRIAPEHRIRPELVSARLQRQVGAIRGCCEHALTRALLELAQERGIPGFCMLPEHRLHQLGTGCHGRLISSTSNDRDSSFGVHLCSRKDLSAQWLSQLGLPTPRQLLLERDCSPGRLQQAALKLGYPCVIKPVDGEQGRGVTAAIADASQLQAAFERALQHTKRGVLLQTHVAGIDHRLVVCGGRLAYAVRREAPRIEGNGVQTVAALIDEANQVRRERRRLDGLTGTLDLDADLLERLASQGYTPESVPPPGVSILLRAHANVSTGALFEDVSGQVHPRLRQQAERIAASLRLDLIGIDYLLTDVSADPAVTPATILELNSMPQAAPNRAPLLLDNLFPPGVAHSIPAVVVICALASTPETVLQQLLKRAVALAPQAELCAPQPLPAALQMQAERLSRPLRGYRHPSEPLLDASCPAVIYVVDPSVVTRQGLPLPSPDQVICVLAAERPDLEDWRRLFRSLGCPVQLGLQQTVPPQP